MAIIQTQRNSVHFEEPEPDDVVIEVALLAPAGDGKHTRPISLGWFHVCDFQGWVDWAVGMADQMARPIYILPLSFNDIFRTGRFTPYRDLLQSLTDLEWGELRHYLSVNCAKLMRNGHEPSICSDAVIALILLNALCPNPVTR